MKCISTPIKIAFLILLLVVSTKGHAQFRAIDLHKTPLSTFFESSVYNGGIQNWRFAQDSSGLLYVANSFGLLEFDGKNWTRYDVPNSTKTRALHIDENNTIFVGGQGQLGYFKVQRGGMHFTSLLSAVPGSIKAVDEVWTIFQHNERIHCQTSGGLLQIQDTSLSLIHADIASSFSVNDQLIVQTQDGRLHNIFNNALLPWITEARAFSTIVSLISIDQGYLIFCNDGKVFSVSSSAEVIERKPLSDIFEKPIINVALRLSSGRIAIGTQNDGLFILSPELQVIQHLTKKQGLDHRTVYSLYEDPFQNLWVGLNNGISYIELGSPLSLINEEVGLEGTGYTATIHQGQLYLGTNNGLFTKPSATTPQQYEIIPESEGQVYNLASIRNDLIMGHHKGAFVVSDDQLTHFYAKSGAWKFIPTADPEKIVGGTYEGMSVFRKADDAWVEQSRLKDFVESSRIMEWENDSLLWMTHGYKGAYRIRFSKDLLRVKEIRRFGENDGFPSNLLISVYKLNDRLIFTSERGIYVFDPITETFTLNDYLTKLIGLNHVSKIVSFGDGNMLYIANDALGMLIQKSFGQYEKEMNVFKRVNKFLSNDLENITVLDERNILIGAKEGFIHYDPSVPLFEKRPFSASIRSVEINSGDTSTLIPSVFFENERLRDLSAVKFNFAAPYFDGFEGLQYSHRLVPFEENWSAWTGTTTKEYTNLPPGEYTFEVRALNIYGEISSTNSSSFKLLAPWYKSNLAYVFYGSFGLILFGFISFLQDRKYRAEKMLLHQSKEEALKEKDMELSQLSETSQKQIEDLKNQKLKAEIHHKNNQLASVTMHLINKNEFVQEVRKRIDHMLQERSASTEELRKIIKTIDRNMTEDDSWDQFSYHFDQVHGDFLKKLSNDVDKLTPQETKLAAYLRMNMSSKEIANLMNISVRGVELARYRLRKKLGLDRDQNLNDYLMQV